MFRSCLVSVVVIHVIAAAASGEPLQILTYNIHGTPFIANQVGKISNPSKRIAAICRRIAELPELDVAMLQEDFAYRDELVGCLDDRVRVYDGNGPAFRFGYIVAAPLWIPLLVVGNVGLWPMFSGAGLTMLVLNPALDVELLASEPYERCGDYGSNGFDCFAAKGYLALRIKTSSGASVDVYNTHLESGRELFAFQRDQSVRRSQLDQLARGIERMSSGRPVIVAGDLNFDHRFAEESAPVGSFAQSLGLADAHVWSAIGVAWPPLDYILHRTGMEGASQLVLQWRCEERAFSAGSECTLRGQGCGVTAEGCEGLSDHPALSAQFELTH